MQADGAARRGAPLTSKPSSSFKQGADNEQRDQQVVRTDNSQPATAIATLVTQSVNALAEPIKRTLASPALKKAVLGSALLALLVILTFGTAILAYAVFYYLYVPNVGLAKEVLLNYGHNKTPFASVDLARAGIASDLVYDVILHLIVPASPRNMDLGNFMVDVAFQSSNGVTIKQAARAASLTWTPPLVRSIQTLLRLPAFLLWNSYSHTQHLRIPVLMKASLRTFASPKIARALIEVGRGDLTSELAASSSSQGSASAAELHVYSASLEIVTHLSGLRWLMYHHRIISFLLFCSTFFFVSLISALLLWAVAGYTLNSRATIEAEETSSEKRLDRAEEIHEDATSVKTEDTESEWEAPKPLKPLARTPSSVSQSRTGKGLSPQRTDATRQELEDQAHRLTQIRARGGDFLHSESDSGEERKPGMLAHIDFADTDVAAKSTKFSKQPQEEEDAVLIRPKGSSSEESSSQSSPTWENVSPQEEHATSMVVKKEDDIRLDEKDVWSSLGTAKTHSTARQAENVALRRRPSSRSLKQSNVE